MDIRGMVQPRWLCLVVCLCIGGPAAPIMAEVVALGQAVEQSGNGKINWTTGWVQATGLGAPPANMGPGQAKAMAERAAKLDALRNLLEAVQGVRVDSATLVENFIATKDVIKTQVQGFVRGAQIVKKDAQSDGGVEVTVQIPLWGADSLISPFVNEKAIGSQNLPPEAETEEGPTGLVIDARGLGVKPAFFPVILDEKGTVVYGPDMIDRGTVESNGAVQYQTLPKGANISSVFGEDAYVVRPVQIAPLPREGRRPLKIKGADKAGALKANILISSDDAKKIREDAQMGGALRRSKVVIVTDPLIGGMEGRLPMPEGVLTAVYSIEERRK